MPRKSHSASHGAKSKDIGSRGTLPIIEPANSRHSDFVVPDGNAMQKIEILSGSVSQPLAPIGTPPLKIDVQSDLRLDTSRYLVSCKISFCIQCLENVDCIFATGHSR